MLGKLLLFGAIAAALVICCTPDVTWANLDYDLFDFLYNTAAFNVGHAAGFPLYIMLGWLVVKLPGNDAWNLAFFLSATPMFITCLLVFYIVNRKTTKKIAPYVATAAVAGSQVMFSQAIIPELYSLMIMLIVASYVLCEVGKTRWAMIAIGLGMTVHYLALLVVPVLMWYYMKGNRRSTILGNLFLAALPLLLYIQVPLANRPPHLSLGPNSFDNYYFYLAHHGTMLFGLPIWEFPQRFGEGAIVLIGSLGVALILGIRGVLRKENRVLLWIGLPGVIYYLSTLGPTAYVHTIPGLTFLCIAAGLEVDNVGWSRLVPRAALLCSLILLSTNVWFYDIGRTLDPSPTGARNFLTMLDDVEDDALLISWDAVAYAGVHYYNLTTGRELRVIHPLFVDPEGAFDHEKARYPELSLDYGSVDSPLQMPKSSDDWLRDFNAWTMTHSLAFAERNPQVHMYAVLSDLEDRSRRNIWLVDLSGEQPLASQFLDGSLSRPQ